MTVVTLTHVRTRLALHPVRPARSHDPSVRPLLLLHGLGEHTMPTAPSATDGWPGPVWGLDFTGHGRSSLPKGGGYTAEALLADVDAALGYLVPEGIGGPVTVLGRGLGGYVALLIAGARPELVGGAVITDGPGLAGGGPAPQSSSVVRTRPPGPASATPDPYALLELARDVRPGDYATAYARQAVEFGPVDNPVTVATRFRPPWLEAIVSELGVVVEPIEVALARYAAFTP